MITRSFDFVGELRSAAPKWQFLPWVNVLALGLLLATLSSRVVIAPGQEVTLPRTSGADVIALGTSAVLTVKANDLLFFEGRKLGIGELEATLRAHVERRGATAMLLRMDRGLPLETLTRILDVARRAGIAQVQLAMETAPAPAQTGGGQGGD